MGRRGRFLIVTWEGGGNVPPAIALGYRLLHAGHDVRVLGPRSVGGTADAAGVQFVRYSSVPAWPPDISLDDVSPGELLNGNGVVEDMVAEIRRKPADVLVVDCMMGAALAAAEHLDLPTVVLVHVLYRPFVEQWGQYVLDSDAPRVGLGLEPLPSPMPNEPLARAGLVLALVPEGFDFDGNALPTNTTYVGPIFLPHPVHAASYPPWLATHSDPLVLVSFSTTLQRQRETIPPVMDALSILPVRGLLTLGGVLSPEELAVPENVVAHTYLPHAAVLPHTAVVVSHGGLSTIMAALAHGVPLLCIPQGREQGLNAERVEAIGAGRQLPNDASPDDIAAAVTAVIEDTRYRTAAEGMADRIAQGEGGMVATRLVESLLI